MKSEEIQDLLNLTAEEICPQLRLEFLGDRDNQFLQTSYILPSNHVTFDEREVEKNNGENLRKLFKRRVERSLVDLRKMILEDLRELRGK